jgi:hypothetical protein
VKGRIPALRIVLPIEADRPRIFFDSDSMEDELALRRWLLTRPEVLERLGIDLDSILSPFDGSAA